ncbi:MAG: hypothetical protein OEM52_06845 [bacterium]|nr:hypothetical protein [bacterium]
MSQFRTSLFSLLHVIVVAIWIATGVIAPCLCSHSHTDEFLEQAVTVPCANCEPEPEPLPSCCANEITNTNDDATHSGSNSSPFTKTCQHTSERLNIGHLTTDNSLPLPDVNDYTLTLPIADVFDNSLYLPISAPYSPIAFGKTASSALYGRTLPLLS